ncbi:hypothetical protein I5M27_17560 [Adhaeribacter sp. BT258]|uniref:SEC-C motif-containing protein n=1 Tax=Adhaeribacter terrigena TaxID=2793070 RepID=A0ABS1C602_9BACT|nr:hypothetical protein [Adhaeribacter terrigena]MBK0404803.1 hypothetical protein [Adhaeribacter terrigena]
MKTAKHSKNELFEIEDEFHAESQGQFDNYAAALAELQRRTKIPWNEKPNKCPCTNWKNCHRDFQIIHYDTKEIPWKELNRTDVYRISAKGIEWKE